MILSAYVDTASTAHFRWGSNVHHSCYHQGLPTKRDHGDLIVGLQAGAMADKATGDVLRTAQGGYMELNYTAVNAALP